MAAKALVDMEEVVIPLLEYIGGGEYYKTEIAGYFLTGGGHTPEDTTWSRLKTLEGLGYIEFYKKDPKVERDTKREYVRLAEKGKARIAGRGGKLLRR